MSVSNRSNGYPSLIPFVVFLVVLNLLYVALVIFYVNSSVQYKRDYRIDEKIFVSAVENVVTNFLQQLLSDDASHLESSQLASPNLNVKVVCDSSIAFASSPRLGDYLLIDGVRHLQGDYCQYGLIVGISSERAYCRKDEDYIVLRAKSERANSWFDSGRGSVAVPLSGGEGGKIPSPPLRGADDAPI